MRADCYSSIHEGIISLFVSNSDIGTTGYPVVAVGAVIVDGRYVLLVKHHPTKKGFWAERWI